MNSSAAPFSRDLLSRVEDAGINASAPREQLWIDGWLVRFSPGKAKRARCIQAVADGRLSLDERLRRCLAVYQRSGLRAYVRITPFSAPQGLDVELARRGMESVDDTRVMVAALLIPAPSAALSPGLRMEEVDADTFTEWVGEQRGSPPSARLAHAERVRQSPVRHRALLLKDETGATLAGGQVVAEADLAGLYDVFTTESARGHGHAATLCRALLDVAVNDGVTTAYLQVEADNAPARAVYARLGFVDAYGYHYRSPPESGAT